MCNISYNFFFSYVSIKIIARKENEIEENYGQKRQKRKGTEKRKKNEIIKSCGKIMGFLSECACVDVYFVYVAYASRKKIMAHEKKNNKTYKINDCS